MIFSVHKRVRIFHRWRCSCDSAVPEGSPAALYAGGVRPGDDERGVRVLYAGLPAGDKRHQPRGCVDGGRRQGRRRQEGIRGRLPRTLQKINK